MNTPRVTIIILNFNGLSDTRKSIKCVLATRYRNLRVIVVDNGSKNNESKLLQKELKDKRITFLRFRKNFGFTGGNNRALSHIYSKYVLLLNSDARVNKTALHNLVRQAEENRSVAVLQPKILFLNNPKFFEYTGAAGGYIDSFGYPFARGRFVFHMEEDLGQYDDAAYLDWAGGSALFFRMNILKKVGGLFDEDFFAQQEEIDFCLRVKRAGYKIQFCPQAIVLHRGIVSSADRLNKKIFWTHRNNLFVLTKHFSLKRLLWLFPLRAALDTGSMFFYLASGQTRFVYEVIRAYLSFLSYLPKTIHKRRKLFKLFPTSADSLIHGGTIVFDYFILGKRKYSQLRSEKKDQVRSSTSHSPYYGDISQLIRIRRNMLSHYKNIINKIFTI